MDLSLTLIIIIITVAASLAAFNNEALYRKGVLNPYLMFENGEYWRLISSGFLHGNYMHLGFNMFTFFFFGRQVELIFNRILGETGPVFFIIFYISAIIVSDLPVAFKQKNNPGYNSLGASGAVSALVFASIIYFPLQDLCLYGLLCLPGFILGVIYIIYSYFQGKRMSDNINHEAHLYGAIYGIVFGIIVDPSAAGRFIEQVLSYRIF